MALFSLMSMQLLAQLLQDAHQNVICTCSAADVRATVSHVVSKIQKLWVFLLWAFIHFSCFCFIHDCLDIHLRLFSIHFFFSCFLFFLFALHGFMLCDNVMLTSINKFLKTGNLRHFIWELQALYSMETWLCPANSLIINHCQDEYTALIFSYIWSLYPGSSLIQSQCSKSSHSVQLSYFRGFEIW